MKSAKILKQLSALFLMLCCVWATVISAYAEEIQPQSDATINSSTVLSINLSGQASCNLNVNARTASYSIEATMSLKQIGRSTPLKSWKGSGIGRLLLAHSYYVPKGYDYQVVAAITVKDANGKLIETFTTESAIVHY